MACYGPGKSFLRDSSDEDEDDATGNKVHMGFVTNAASTGSIIETPVKEKDKGRVGEKRGVGHTKSRRESIATSSLLPLRWSKITPSDARDVKTNPGRNNSRGEANLVSTSTSTSKKQRRCSMSDAPACLGLELGAKFNINTNKPVLSTVASMVSEQELPASSPTKKLAGNIHPRSRYHGADDEDSINCRSVGLLRSAFGSKNSGKKRMKVKTKQVASLHALNNSFHATIPAEAMPTPARHLTGRDCSEKPVHLFRGGAGWNRFKLDCESLHIDLFWPTATGSLNKEKVEGKEKVKIKTEEIQNPFDDDNEFAISDDEDGDIFPLEMMAPLWNFRNLRFLRLTGMSQSYQKHIWQAAWLNPGLEELELEMALEPCIRRAFSEWPYIKGGWIQRSKPDGKRSSYYGDDGQGILHRRVGIGEYLDKYAIAHAKARAACMGSTLILLPVVKLSLTGFVVDADPFCLFNPHRLRLINFKNDCVDAGFALPDCMREQVVVSWPKLLSEQATVARQVKHGEIRLIELGSTTKKVADTLADCSAATAKKKVAAAAATTATTTSIATAEKSRVASHDGDIITVMPNFSYPNPHEPVTSPIRAAECSVTLEDTGKDKGKQRDGSKLFSTDIGGNCKKDVKPQQRMRFSPSHKAKR